MMTKVKYTSGKYKIGSLNHSRNSWCVEKNGKFFIINASERYMKERFKPDEEIIRITNRAGNSRIAFS